MLHLSLLGTVEFTADDGRTIHSVLAQPKRLALLAYLAAAHQGFHRRDVLVSLFWPESDLAVTLMSGSPPNRCDQTLPRIRPPAGLFDPAAEIPSASLGGPSSCFERSQETTAVAHATILPSIRARVRNQIIESSLATVVNVALLGGSNFTFPT
jgi:hypothetical protein